MAVNIFTWIILGGIAGWLASLIMKTDAEQGMFANILIGMVGALIGGILSSLVGGPSVTGLNLRSLIVATVGAVAVIALVRMLRGNRSAQY